MKMILCFVFIMAILQFIREAWRFTRSFREQTKYESNWVRTLFTFASISYIISYLIYAV